ncbi:MAG: hypothetical protein U9R02_10320 [Thermodesulfobacteriota bacterium]|nr:hypothetical protein [Thermodesulfobacteriota bacterium]
MSFCVGLWLILSFEISDKFLDDDLTAEFRGMYFTSPVCVRLASTCAGEPHADRRTGRNDGSACEIFAEYKIRDNWHIAPGYMSFSGPKNSRLGQFKNNDMVYLRLRYSF